MTPVFPVTQVHRFVCVNIPVHAPGKIPAASIDLGEISEIPVFTGRTSGVREAQTARSDLGFIRKVFMRLHIYVEAETNIPNGVARRTQLRSILLRRSLSPVFPRGARPSSYLRGVPSGLRREGHQHAWQAQGGTADHDRTRDTGPWGRPR